MIHLGEILAVSCSGNCSVCIHLYGAHLCEAFTYARQNRVHAVLLHACAQGICNWENKHCFAYHLPLSTGHINHLKCDSKTSRTWWLKRISFRRILTGSSFVAMNWEVMHLSIILWVKRDIVLQHNKIINALRQCKMSFSSCIIQCLMPYVVMTMPYCQYSVNSPFFLILPTS